MPNRAIAYLLPALLICAGSAIRAESIVFPDGAKVVNVAKSPYFADTTGKTDVTATLQRVIGDMRSNGWAPGFIYLPNGTYRVSNTVAFREPPDNMGMHMWGQSTQRTVIRLADNTWTNPADPHIVLKTGDGVAQCFCRGVHNLTVNTGRNNAGAIGVRWFANNEGLMSDVNIVSEDGSGLVGLDLTGGEQGPSEARGIYIKGFQTGIRTNALNAVILRDIRLEGQTGIGITNELHPLWIDSLVSVNSVQAVKNTRGGYLVLANARLSGGSPTVDAMKNEAGGVLFIRDISTQGYRNALYSPSTSKLSTPQGPSIAEWSSHGEVSLFASPSQSMRLEEKRPPEVAWEQNLSKWAVVSDYRVNGRTDAQAFQAAIDDASKTTVCLPYGVNLQLDAPVYVRGTISRIVGTGTVCRGREIIVTDGATPVVKMHNLVTIDQVCPIVVRTGRTVVLEAITHHPISAEGTGELFIDDAASDLHVTNSRQRVWAWHYNCEGINTIIDAGQVRIFGWKTEGEGTKLTLNGGSTELLGFLAYNGCEDKSQTPLIKASNARWTLANMSQMSFCNSYYSRLIQETRSGTTLELSSAQNPLGGNIPLYTSYDGASATGRVAQRVEGGAHRVVLVDKGFGRSVDITLSLGRRTSVTSYLIDPMGRTLCSSARRSIDPGVHALSLDVPRRFHGASILVVEEDGVRTARSLMLD